MERRNRKTVEKNKTQMGQQVEEREQKHKAPRQSMNRQMNMTPTTYTYNIKKKEKKGGYWGLMMILHDKCEELIFRPK